MVEDLSKAAPVKDYESEVTFVGANPDIQDPYGTAFSGADITASIFIPGERMKSGEDFFKVFAELQTITVSSMRSVGAVRRLGESFVPEYTRGNRTIAGTMVFTLLKQDVMQEIVREARREVSEPFFHDRLPPFNLHFVGINEVTAREVRAAILGVTITNAGVTFSIDDLFIEQTYTYVASYYQALSSTDKMKEVAKRYYEGAATSKIELASRFLNDAIMKLGAGYPEKYINAWW